MAKYNINDNVLVRSDLIDEHGYGDNCFVSGMRSALGKIVTITHVDDRGQYHINDSWYFYWTNEMFVGKVIGNKVIKGE